MPVYCGVTGCVACGETYLRCNFPSRSDPMRGMRIRADMGIGAVVDLYPSPVFMIEVKLLLGIFWRRRIGKVRHLHASNRASSMVRHLGTLQHHHPRISQNNDIRCFSVTVTATATATAAAFSCCFGAVSVAVSVLHIHRCLCHVSLLPCSTLFHLVPPPHESLFFLHD